MEDCKMPYVGGVSGSILEQLAFYVDRGGALDNELLLVLMAVLNLSGHHSLGEAWATTKVFLDKMGVLDEDVVKNVVNMRDTVPVPVDLKKGCTEGLDEEKFLDALEEVVEKAFE